MTVKSIFMVGALLLSTVSLVSAKTYDIHISSPTMAGNVQLPAGEYKLKVDGTNAVLTDVDNDKKFTTTVKVETEDKKFEQTAVVTDDSKGTNQIKSIELGGSTTKLEFGE